MLRDNAIDKTIVIDGITYFFDSVRSKWLSIHRCCIDFSINHKNIKSNRWLAVASGIYSNNVSYLIPRKGTITTVTFQAKEPSTSEVEFYSNNDLILTIALNNEINKISEVDVDIEQGINIKCFLKNPLKIDYPLVSIQASSRR